MDMTTAFLRSLESAILADSECMLYAILPDQDKVLSAIAFEQDREVAAILNRKGYANTSKAVSCHLAKKLLIKRGKWRGIVLASFNESHPAVEAAYAAVALAEDARMDADFCDPAAEPLLGALVESKLLSADDAEALKSLCRTPSAITADQVSRALRGPWGDEKE